PYREVYNEIAKLIKDSKSVEEFYAKVEGLYGIKANLEKGIEKPVLGSPNPTKVKEYIKLAKTVLEEDFLKLNEVIM
ncbi:argininosuccinate lyase, partial [Thermococci archaeon]